MKKLILRYVSSSGGRVHFKIEEQTHREDDFGINSRTFTISNGIDLTSISLPDFDYYNGTLFCRGDCLEDDDNIVITTMDQWNMIKEAVKEYNKLFGYHGECILDDPYGVKLNVVPIEMFVIE